MHQRTRHHIKSNEIEWPLRLSHYQNNSLLINNTLFVPNAWVSGVIDSMAFIGYLCSEIAKQKWSLNVKYQRNHIGSGFSFKILKKKNKIWNGQTPSQLNLQVKVKRSTPSERWRRMQQMQFDLWTKRIVPASYERKYSTLRVIDIHYLLQNSYMINNFIV